MIKTRKSHKCAGCKKIFPKNTLMRKDRVPIKLLNNVRYLYWCKDCIGKYEVWTY